MTRMTTSPHAAREAARASDGRFGTQPRTRPGDDDRYDGWPTLDVLTDTDYATARLTAVAGDPGQVAYADVRRGYNDYLTPQVAARLATDLPHLDPGEVAERGRKIAWAGVMAAWAETEPAQAVTETSGTVDDLHSDLPWQDVAGIWGEADPELQGREAADQWRREAADQMERARRADEQRALPSPATAAAAG